MKRPAVLARAAEDLCIALQVRVPKIRSLLLTGVECPGVEALAEQLQVALRSAGKDVALIRPGGRSEFVPEPLLDVANLRDAIAELAGTHIVIAVALDVAGPDAGPMLASVEGAVLVVRDQRTQSESLVRAVDRARNLGCGLVGAVLVEEDI